MGLMEYLLTFIKREREGGMMK